jgi:methyltransferase (TIGR00027 family)
MRADRASRTAEYNALFRALETARAPQCRVIDDRLAERLLRQPLRAAASSAGLAAVVARYIDCRQPGARPSVIARTRLIDDCLIAALEDGIVQVAILGAGFDTRAYRIAGIENARVFEVDHPSTTAIKQERIRRALGKTPPQVRYVSCDFDRGSLGDALARSGFDAASLTFFIWEGVTGYLTEAAVAATLKFVGGAPTGSRLVFTYVHRDILRHPERFSGGERLHRRLNKLEEPLTFGLDPALVPDFLAAHGLRLIEDIGSVDYRTRFLGANGAHLRGHEFYRLAIAQVERGPSANSPNEPRCQK